MKLEHGLLKTLRHLIHEDNYGYEVLENKEPNSSDSFRNLILVSKYLNNLVCIMLWANTLFSKKDSLYVFITNCCNSPRAKNSKILS